MKFFTYSLFMFISMGLVDLSAETDPSKAIVSYIQEHLKNGTTPLPDSLKSKAADITLLENVLKDQTVSLDKIPPAVLEKCKDKVFRDAFLALVSALKIKIVSDDKTIQLIIKKLSDKDVYSYFSAKIDTLLADSTSFTSALKSASQEVKDCTLLELLLNTASQFGTTKDYQRTDSFKKNETFIKSTIGAGAKINTVINKLENLGLAATEQETFINSLFAPHVDFIDFLLKNGLDKNLTLPAGGTQKKRTLAEFYDDQSQAVTEKLAQVVSTELKDTQEEIKKIVALVKQPEPKK